MNNDNIYSTWFLKFYRKYIFLYRAFTSLCYSADGECLIAGGMSKNVCIYNVEKALLLRKFEITQNRSLDAVDVSDVNIYRYYSITSAFLGFHKQKKVNRVWKYRTR